MDDTSGDQQSTMEDAILVELLSRFPQYLDNRWIQIDADRGYFGDGSNGENGIRTNTNVAFTAAVLATDPSNFNIDAAVAILLRDRCKAVLRYVVDSHMTQQGTCANGGKWGLEWQSAWWATKLALAARLIWRELTPGDREKVAALVVAEADRQLSRIVPTGLHLDTKAEENAWDAEILASAIALLPGHPHRTRWLKKLIEFSANVFSSPHDRISENVLDGQPVRDLIYTCNVHGDYSLENHGSYHFCYVASPLLSKGWCAYALRSADTAIPEALYHNVGNVWALAEKTFLRNRFAYISGQDWARYAYGEYFIVPALVFLDMSMRAAHAAEILIARLQCLARETRGNADGSFFGARFTAGQFGGQHGKYETDCFCCMALAWSLRRVAIEKNELAVLPATPHFQHVSVEGQFCFQRGPDTFFSFSWATLEEAVPNVTLIPLKDDSLAEWHAGNGIGTVKLPGVPVASVGVHAMKADEGGISIEGVSLICDRRNRYLIEHSLRVRYDSNAGTVSIESKYMSRARLWLAVITGISLQIPNDIFNSGSRSVAYEGGSLTLETHPAQDRQRETRKPKGSFGRLVERLSVVFGKDGSVVKRLRTNWLNIDDALGLAVGNEGEIVIRRFPTRKSAWGSLFVEQIEAPIRRIAFFVPPGKKLLDSKIVIHVGTSDQSRSIALRLAERFSSSAQLQTAD
jgi:hypothetical protein